jgi:hypothetical protein
MRKNKIRALDTDPVVRHNCAIEKEAAQLLRSNNPPFGPQLTPAESDEATRLMRGIILNPDYLEFLSRIAITSAQSFYQDTQDIKKLLDKDLSENERCELVVDYITHFSNAVNCELSRNIIFAPQLKESETIFPTPHVDTFQAPSKGNAGSNGEADIIQFGEFRNGRMMVFDRFGTHYNQYVRLNTHDDAIKDSFVLRQIYAIAHEGGHAIEDFIKTRYEAGMPATPDMIDMIDRTRLSVDSDNSYEAYKASATEQYADFLGHVVATELFNQLIDGGLVKSAEDQNIAKKSLKYSLGIIQATKARTFLAPH